jgi:hypothetical protein
MMAAGLLSRLRTVTAHAFGLTDTALLQADAATPALLARLTSPRTDLIRADAGWRPDTQCLRVEIMAGGAFENLRGMGAAINRLQDNLACAAGNGGIELQLRLTEVRRNCRHITAWSRSPVDPVAVTTEWECIAEAFGDDPEYQTLWAQTFQDSVRHGVHHIVLFGDSFDDGTLTLNSAMRTFRQHGIRVSTFYLGNEFIGHSRYRLLAVGTGGLHLSLPARKCHEQDHERLDAAAVSIVAAFACGDHSRFAALPASTPEARALLKQLRR